MICRPNKYLSPEMYFFMNQLFLFILSLLHKTLLILFLTWCFLSPFLAIFLTKLIHLLLPQILDSNSPIPNLSSPTHFSPLASSIRQPKRVKHPPSYLRDYHCHLLSHSFPAHSSNILYPLSQVLSYNSLSPSHKNFVLNVSSNYKPQFYHQAVPFLRWRTSISKELAAIESNNTWTIVPLPADKHTIGCHWIYKIKYGSTGNIETYKATPSC